MSDVNLDPGEGNGGGGEGGAEHEAKLFGWNPDYEGPGKKSAAEFLEEGKRMKRLICWLGGHKLHAPTMFGALRNCDCGNRWEPQFRIGQTIKIKLPSSWQGHANG